MAIRTNRMTLLPTAFVAAISNAAPTLRTTEPHEPQKHFENGDLIDIDGILKRMPFSFSCRVGVPLRGVGEASFERRQDLAAKNKRSINFS